MAKIAVVTNTNKMDAKRVRDLRRSLANAGLDDVRWVEIAHGSDAKAAAAKALKRGAETIVVCGGDGTVRAAAEAVVGTSTGLVVVPTGTANLFAAGLELPTEIDDIVDLIARRDHRRIDSAVCNGHAFNVMAGSGFDVGMLDGAEDSKERIGIFAYVRAAVHEARHRKMFATKITIDGKRFYKGKTSLVLVGNVGALKGGVELFPGATAIDGRLHIAAVTANGLRQWAALLVAAVLRRPQRSSHAEIGEGTSVVVTFKKKRLFELDGGVKGRTKRLEFSIRPRSLLVYAPTVYEPTNVPASTG